MTAKKTNYDGVSIIVTLLKVDVFYGLAESFTISDAYSALRLVLVDGDSNEKRREKHITGSVKLHDDPAKEETWGFHDLQGADHRGVSVLHLYVVSVRSIE